VTATILRVLNALTLARSMALVCALAGASLAIARSVQLSPELRPWNVCQRRCPAAESVAVSMITVLEGLMAGTAHVFAGPDHLVGVAPLAVDRPRPAGAQRGEPGAWARPGASGMASASPARAGESDAPRCGRGGDRLRLGGAPGRHRVDRAGLHRDQARSALGAGEGRLASVLPRPRVSGSSSANCAR